jgi:hypothetical protein
MEQDEDSVSCFFYAQPKTAALIQLPRQATGYGTRDPKLSVSRPGSEMQNYCVVGAPDDKFVV